MPVFAEIRPLHISSDEPFTVVVSEAADLVGRTITAVIHSCDALETEWIASLPVDIDSEGNGTGTHPGLRVEREAAIWVNELQWTSGTHYFEIVSPALVSAPNCAASSEVPAAALERIIAEQEATYSRPLGDPTSASTKKHRVVYGLEGVYLTKPMRLPGLTISPLENRPGGTDDLALMNVALEMAGSTRTIENQDAWVAGYHSARPWTSVSFAEVWAADHVEAEAITSEPLAQVISLLALSRGARGKVIAFATEVEDPPGFSGAFKIRQYEPPYRGNLLGGSMGGEHQGTFKRNADSLKRDPILRLSLDLFADAIAEPNVDLRLFRLWSALEILAINRIPSGSPVTLTDGSLWPNGSTTSHAGPRVYALLKQSMRGIDETSMVAPAQDLYHAVRAWNGRRDATAHYGGFDASSVAQSGRPWFVFAQLTTANSDTDSWVRMFRELCRSVFRQELSQGDRPSSRECPCPP
jgi:hypothetical protein